MRRKSGYPYEKNVGSSHPCFTKQTTRVVLKTFDYIGKLPQDERRDFVATVILKYIQEEKKKKKRNEPIRSPIAFSLKISYFKVFELNRERKKRPISFSQFDTNTDNQTPQVVQSRLAEPQPIPLDKLVHLEACDLIREALLGPNVSEEDRCLAEWLMADSGSQKKFASIHDLSEATVSRRVKKLFTRTVKCLK